MHCVYGLKIAEKYYFVSNLMIMTLYSRRRNIMKRIILTCVIAASLLIGCKGKNDVVATYSGGNITRGDFYLWMDAHNMNKEAVLKKKKMQKFRLETMGEWMLAAREAVKKGFDKSDEFKIIEEISAESQIANRVYEKEIKEKAEFEEPAVRFRQIVIRVKSYGLKDNKRVPLTKEQMAVNMQEAMGKGRDIIQKLKAGESFKVLAKEHSDDISRNKGGDVGYQTKYSLHPQIAKAAFSLKEDAYTAEPIQLMNGVYIIQVIDKDVLTSRNIDSVVSNEVMAKRLKQMLYRKAAEQYLNALMNAKDVVLNIEKAGNGNPVDVIFQVGGTKYTNSDLEGRISMILSRINRGEGKKREITVLQKQRLAQNIFKFHLLKRVALQKKLLDDSEYKKEAAFRRESILGREYMRSFGTGKISVSENEIRAEYDRNREHRYFTKENRGGKEVKVILPYHKIRDRIERMISIRQRSLLLKKWKNDVMIENNFTIIEKNLEGE